MGKIVKTLDLFYSFYGIQMYNVCIKGSYFLFELKWCTDFIFRFCSATKKMSEKLFVNLFLVFKWHQNADFKFNKKE